MEIVKEIKKPRILTEEEFFEGLEKAEDDIRSGRIMSFEEAKKKWEEIYEI